MVFAHLHWIRRDRNATFELGLRLVVVWQTEGEKFMSSFSSDPWVFCQPVRKTKQNAEFRYFTVRNWRLFVWTFLRCYVYWPVASYWVMLFPEPFLFHPTKVSKLGLIPLLYLNTTRSLPLHDIWIVRATASARPDSFGSSPLWSLCNLPWPFAETCFHECHGL